MTWIDDRLAEKAAQEERESRMFNEAPKLHGELWKEILRQVEEAKGKGFNTMMVTSDEILLPMKPARGESSASPLKLSLQLKKDHSAIVANITGGDVTFRVGMNGNAATLKQEDKPLSVVDATILILDSFLFPELKRLDVHKLTTWKNL